MASTPVLQDDLVMDNDGRRRYTPLICLCVRACVDACVCTQVIVLFQQSSAMLDRICYFLTLTSLRESVHHRV